MNSALDQKILHIFGEMVINKDTVRALKIREARTIPSFVEEWLISRFAQPGVAEQQIYSDITNFMSRHLPAKSEKELIKKRLHDGEQIVLLDKYEARIDIANGYSLVKIPSLDIADARVAGEVLDNHDKLLSGGLWGAGKITVKNDENSSQRNRKRLIELIEFQPMQSGRVRLEEMIHAREQFTTEEWIYLLIRTMGYEPDSYHPEERYNLIMRLLPLVHKNINMMELAPKGTGKSFIFSNLSRYVWVNSGGSLSQAQLFKNLRTRELGLLARHDLLVLDEGQSINFKGSDDIHAKFKFFLESGHYSIGSDTITSECGLMVLANIDLVGGKPARRDYIRHLPEMFHDDALLDRFHAIIPGWEIPRFTTRHIAQGVGLKADLFGEYLHQLRTVSSYEFPYGEIPDMSGDIRDKKAVERLCVALSKLLMLNPDHADYDSYVYQPACSLRERVKTQLAAVNPNEFVPQLKVERENE
ncbi:BREX system Lon protease-like protein BrxL [Ectothiorhodospiraceae bacterium BW-2]|nr:BREX system Lon protease-like protein BrxL [Ectothiorhodospiraceae bacterium BW-2]